MTTPCLVPPPPPPIVSDTEILTEFFKTTGGRDWFVKDGWLQGRVCPCRKEEEYEVIRSPKDKKHRCNLGHHRHHHHSDSDSDSDSDDEDGKCPKTAPLPCLGNSTTAEDILERAIKSRWFGVQCYHGRVVSISLPGNNISGQLTPGMLNLTELVNLDLSLNGISGQFPTTNTSKHWHHLWKINLAGNDLSGPLPSWFADLSQLQTILVNENRFNGSIPAFGHHNFTSLVFASFANNNFSGSIPPMLEDLAGQHSTQLRLVDVSRNRWLNGSLVRQFNNSAEDCPHTITRNCTCNNAFQPKCKLSFLRFYCTASNDCRCTYFNTCDVN